MALQLISKDMVEHDVVDIMKYAKGDGTTDDTQGVISAIAEAYSKGYTVNWGLDSRTFLTTNTIPNFHQVKHVGNGIVKRGTDLFYISPKGTQTNKIYVGVASSSTTFDGLSASKPVARIQNAFDWLENYSPVLTGYWQIIMTSGTFSFPATLQDGLLSENPILLKGADVGGHPNVPTTILTQGNGTSGTGIKITGGSNLIIQDIKIVGYNGSTSSSGTSCAESCRLYHINVHFTDCYYGATGSHRSYLDVKGGIFDHCGYTSGGSANGSAIRSLMLTNHYIGNQFGTSLGVIIKNCYFGMFAQESSTGHVNWVDFQDNAYAVRLNVSSRANLDGCSFKRSTIADVRATGNSNYFIPSNCVFGTGADASASPIMNLDGSSVTTDVGVITLEKDVSNNIVERTFDVQFPNTTITTTTSTPFYTLTLKAPFWTYTKGTIAVGKKLMFKIIGTFTGTASIKRITCRLGNTLVQCVFSATDVGVFEANGFISMNGTNSSTQYMFISGNRHLSGSAKLGSAKANNSMSSDVPLTFEASLDTGGGDSVIIDYIEVSWAG